MRQHIYDFRSGLADRAERAVEDFFNNYSQFDSPEEKQTYVKWAVPPPKIITDSKGRRLLAEDHQFPYMYKYNDKEPMPRATDVGSLLFI